MCGVRYKKGERIVYGTTGICVVEDIIEKKYPDKSDRTCYVLKPISSNGSTLFVPIDSPVIVSRARYVYTAEEIDGIFSSAGKKTIEWQNDKNIRAANFREILSNGITEEFILMLGCLYRRRLSLKGTGKKLSNSDEIILRSAEEAVAEEIAYVFGMTEDAATEYIKEKLGIVE